MGKINVLPFEVANLIAAGEVVDRPASVIKELMENAIDAGATSVVVEIRQGGIAFMRVSDNGCGISREDLPVALRRHATSKIKDRDDLAAIMTLGFRGEALAAIAAVTDVRILSKTADAPMGAQLTAPCGGEVTVEDHGCSNGTTVIVENLFARVPARRKFLKKDVTESMAVSANVEKVALSHPEIAFRLIVDGNVRLETEGDGDLLHTIHSLFGREFAGRMLKVESQAEGITVSGYIGRSDNYKANRNQENFFLNGRFVKSKTIMAALEQAYTSYMPPERFPCCVLWDSAYPRTCVWVQLKDRESGAAFRFYNTHLDHVSELARRKGMELTVGRINADVSNGMTAFLTGDFNSELKPGNAIDYVRKSMNDTAELSVTPHQGPKRTFHGYNPSACMLIDYIFVKGKVRVLSHATLDDMPDGKYPTDHFPVAVTVTL